MHGWLRLLVLLLFFPSPLIFAQDFADSNEKFIQERMQKFMRKHNVSGASVVVLNRGKLKTYVFGYAVPSKHIPVTENTIFELGSITKTFTGIILAKNVVEGQTYLT